MRVGQTLGSYRILEPIGRGGMGVVYLAEHTVLGRKAAVKLLLPEPSRDSELVERFFNEARAAAKIQHAGLVEVLDYGHHTDGSAFIVMELLVGESLAARIEREHKLAITTAMAITRQVSSALHAAHQAGIVHRDLKPENIYLVADADAPAGVRAKVLDFGIAKLARDDEPRSVKTKTGAVFGTPRYMSPEQSKNARNVDGRSDIYALGCILYEMVAGVPPFDFDNWGELIAAHIYVNPKSPREHDPMIPIGVETIVMRMLAKNPDDRYATMLEVAHDAEAVWKEGVGQGRAALFTPPAGFAVASRTTQAPAANAPTLPVAAQVTAPPLARKRRTWIPLAIVAAAAIAGALFWIVPGRDKQVATPSPPPVDRAVEIDKAPADAPVVDAPAAATTVELVVESTPGGAEVFRAADGVKLGKTPFAKRFERTDGEAVFLVKLPGYQPAKVSLSTAQDGKTVARLEREHGHAPHHPDHAQHPLTADRPPPPPPPSRGSGGPTVLDPYGDGR